ncbi:hypothetical protein [uncultured Modestobacter sp.]|uniref:hypothetical protein n=1 Tax=uncultured Modestobacter sp. TaxID=380048 RepID=UPI00262BB520|nr:hypothetical protein [uncultured Modestobacter sp.]
MTTRGWEMAESQQLSAAGVHLTAAALVLTELTGRRSGQDGAARRPHRGAGRE